MTLPFSFIMLIKGIFPTSWNTSPLLICVLQQLVLSQAYWQWQTETCCLMVPHWVSWYLCCPPLLDEWYSCMLCSVDDVWDYNLSFVRETRYVWISPITLVFLAQNCTAITVVSESADVNEITTSLKNIAAAHFIIVLAITGECLLQL